MELAKDCEQTPDLFIGCTLVRCCTGKIKNREINVLEIGSIDILLWILNAIWVVTKFFWMIPVHIMEYIYPDSLIATIAGHCLSAGLYLSFVGIGMLFVVGILLILRRRRA